MREEYKVKVFIPHLPPCKVTMGGQHPSTKATALINKYQPFWLLVTSLHPPPLSGGGENRM
jgi:hypothetical protein